MADMLLGGIVINEVLADPNGANNFDTDGNGTASGTDEYIELYNTSGVAIDISGVELWDAGIGNWFTFPPGTTLEPGAHAMVMAGVQSGGNLPTSANPDDLFFHAGRGSPVINNGGDNIVVYDPGADEYIQAVFNGDGLDDPPVDYTGFAPPFSSSATQVGTGEDFGSDNDGFSIQRGPDGTDTFINNQTPTPGTSNVCFTQGTQFETPLGLRRVEDLRPGDLLLTKDNGAQEIQWIWARRHSAATIVANPGLQAVKISKGALGAGLPQRDLRVSRQHRLLLSSRIAKRVFGQEEVLAAAKDLTLIDGIELAPVKGAIIYYHVLMRSHEIIFAEGAPAESLFLGAESLKAIETEALEELRLIFGPDWDAFLNRPAKAVRVLAMGPKMHDLAQRHFRNDQPLLQVYKT